MTNGEIKRISTFWLHVNLLAVLSLLPIVSRAQSTAPPQYVHEIWTIEDGLPVNSINDLVQTPDGYIWLATFDGLVRFDGVRFKVFNSSNTKSLPSNRIIELFLSSDGAVWLRTEQYHLVRFQEGRFTHFGPEDGLAGDLVFDIYEDRQGVVWFGANQGVSIYAEGVLTRFAPDIIREECISILHDRTGQLWVGTSNKGLFLLKAGDTPQLESVEGLAAANQVIALHEAPESTIWVSTEKGVFRYASGNMTSFDGQNSPFSGNTVSQKDHAGYRWLFIGDELYRDGQRVYRTDSNITSFIHDLEGNIWLATHDSGLLRLGPALFQVYSGPEGLANKNIYPILEDTSGAIWFGTWGSGINRLSGGRISHYTTDDGLPGSLIRTLYRDREGDVWVGTWQNGACRFKKERCIPFRVERGWRDLIVEAIYESVDGAFWFGTHFGLFRLAAGEWTHFQNAGGLTHNRVRVIYETRDGTLWMGTNGDGLLIYHDRQFTGLTTANGLSSDLIRSIYEDEDGYVWIGTEGSGLMRLDLSQARSPEESSVTFIRQQHGLFDEVIHQILEDDFGRLWMSTNRGIFWVERGRLNAFAEGRIDRIRSTAYTERAGLRNREANGGVQSAGIKASDGRLWFPTQDGAAVVDPSIIAPNDVPPPVVIEEVELDNIVKSYYGQSLELQAGQRDFEITYTAFSFAAPENMQFRYRLEGLQDNWNEVGNRRTAYFTNVPPGEYNFRVMASNNESIWNKEGASMTLSVAPYFYETSWFYGLIGLAVLMAGFIGYQQRVQHLKTREVALKKRVEDRTKELKHALTKVEEQAEQLKELDTAKSRFFANVSHEFRTPLTLTIGPLEDVRSGLYGSIDPTINDQLEMALRNSHRLLRLVNQLLDIAKLEANRMQLRACETDLAGFLKAMALSFTGAAERKQINFDVALSSNAVPVYFDADQLEKVFTNLLSNAFKFTPEGGAVRLSMQDHAAGTVRLEVKDTGPGIPADELPHIFERFYQVDEMQTRLQAGTGIGLSLAKELVELHGGVLSVESEENFGSTFIVTLRLGRDHLSDDQIDECRVAGTEFQMAPEIEAPDSPFATRHSSFDKTTILVVDDNADLRAYIRNHLETDYRVIEAENGLEALEKARRHLPDLIISDVMMPGLDGHGLCRELKRDRAIDFIPVILLTAKATTEDRVEGFEGGADAYVTKPFEMAELSVQVKSLIASRQRLRERFSQARALHASPVEVVSSDDAFLERVKEVIEAHLPEEDFSVVKLAEEVGQSRGHLHRRLQSLLHQSPSEVIKQIRLERAAQLLEEKAGLVSEIAYAVGFKSVTHFSTSFNTRYGMPPSVYMDKPAAR